MATCDDCLHKFSAGKARSITCDKCIDYSQWKLNHGRYFNKSKEVDADKAKSEHTEKYNSGDDDYAKQLADGHWEYVEDVIRNTSVATGDDTPVCMPFNEYLEIIEFHYKSAMIHGYKHGRAGK